MSEQESKDLMNKVVLAIELAQSSNNIEAVKELLKNNINNESYKQYLQASLFQSIQTGYLEAVDYLLTSSELSEHPNLLSVENPLKVSARKGYLEIFKYFTENFDKYYPESQLDVVYFGLISDASEHGQLNIVEFIVNHPDVKNSRNLSKFEMHSTQWACLRGHLNIVEFYFPKGTDKIFDDNLFLNAVSNSHLDIVKYCIFDLKIPFSEHLNEAFMLYNDEQSNQAKEFFKIRELNTELEKELSSATINQKKIKI
jgi:ankyrin repeat protein